MLITFIQKCFWGISIFLTKSFKRFFEKDFRTKCFDNNFFQKIFQRQNCFFETVNKLNLLGNFNIDKKTYSNDFKVDASFDGLIKKGKIGQFKITKPILAISHKKLISGYFLANRTNSFLNSTLLE